ncbi:uncharacterized protein LOC135133017 isoform X2 [Zophobas morio]|uniref:uncharacterized protein LOC135133017 isoform X2 n=1 Tax=Zophobas morio TaxID=2755281 RepID=UPI003083B114
MWKSFYSLLCYVSDFESLKLGNIKKLNHTLRDHNYYNNEVKHLSQELQTPENVTLHCYTVEVSRDVVIKGYTQKGGCRFLIDVVENVVQKNRGPDQSGMTIGMMGCTECSSDKCNSVILGYLQIEPTHFPTSEEPRGVNSLKCYYCLHPCEIGDAREKICGRNIGKSHEAVCTTEIAKDSRSPTRAVRKCRVVQKNQQPPCPDNSVCTSCKSDLCNENLEDVTTITGVNSLKCYYCLDPCEIADAREEVCEQNIGKSHEAFCTTEIAKDSGSPTRAVRKCQVVEKNQQPPCPENSVCASCKSDLCNGNLEDAATRQGDAIKCHTCAPEACEVSKATEKTCGLSIGSSQEAVCTTEVPKGSKTPNIGIRKCQIVAKGAEPNCPPTSDCTTCKSDLCNSAPSTSSRVAMIGVVTAFVAAKFLLN